MSLMYICMKLLMHRARGIGREAGSGRWWKRGGRVGGGSGEGSEGGEGSSGGGGKSYGGRGGRVKGGGEGEFTLPI